MRQFVERFLKNVDEHGSYSDADSFNKFKFHLDGEMHGLMCSVTVSVEAFREMHPAQFCVTNATHGCLVETILAFMRHYGD